MSGGFVWLNPVVPAFCQRLGMIRLARPAGCASTFVQTIDQRQWPVVDGVVDLPDGPHIFGLVTAGWQRIG